VWVGLDTNVYYLLKYPLLLVGLILMINATKIITSYLMGRKLLGKKQALFLGVSLTVKFSTSIVIIKLLFERGLIPIELYSVLVGTTVLFKFIVPFLLSYMVKKWDGALRT
jgi:Kef-type K+ transport system membrane component KefB